MRPFHDSKGLRLMVSGIDRLGHHDIEQHQVERRCREHGQRLLAVDGGRHVEITLAGEAARQREAIVVDVVDHQQRGIGCVHVGNLAGLEHI